MKPETVTHRRPRKIPQRVYDSLLSWVSCRVEPFRGFRGSSVLSDALFEPVRRVEAEIADPAVLQTVNPGVHVHHLSALPGVLDDGRLAHVARLLDHVQLAQPV